MSPLILLIFVAVVVVVVATQLRRVRRDRRPAPAVAEDSAPTFRVVALGARGSGKTLLLASMFHQLQTPSGRGYFVTAPHDQVVRLSAWFTEVADTSRDWPSGTAVAETRDMTFTVRTRGASGATHTIMRLSYLEYAGGLLTDPQAPGTRAQSDLLSRVESAHALLGIIDGYRVRQSLDGSVEGLARLQQGLTAMISLMMMATCPITFIITKWDLMQDLDIEEDDRLRRVRKLLMSNQGFYDLVQQHSAQRVVRLVPVSAVGPDFAALDRDGMIAKLPLGQLRPTNVDVPLAAVVPDLFEQVERAIDQASLRAAMDRVSRRLRPGPGRALIELGSFVARAASTTLGPLAANVAFLGDAAAELLSNRGGAAPPRPDVDRELSQAQQQFEEFQLARRRVIRDFQRRVDVLEGRLPSSRLSGED